MYTQKCKNCRGTGCIDRGYTGRVFQHGSYVLHEKNQDKCMVCNGSGMLEYRNRFIALLSTRLSLFACAVWVAVPVIGMIYDICHPYASGGINPKSFIALFFMLATIWIPWGITSLIQNRLQKKK